MKITLARPWTDSAGRTHKADRTLDVPDKDARALLHHGHARPPAPGKKKPSTSTPVPKEEA